MMMMELIAIMMIFNEVPSKCCRVFLFPAHNWLDTATHTSQLVCDIPLPLQQSSSQMLPISIRVVVVVVVGVVGAAAMVWPVVPILMLTSHCYG